MRNPIGNKYYRIAALMASVIAVQALTHFTDTQFYLTQLTMTSYYMIVIIGLCMLMGYTGQISIGHAGFFAMGGYSTAFLTTHNFIQHKGQGIVGALEGFGIMMLRTGLYGDEILHVHPWAACIFAVALTSCVAYLIGGPVLRLKGHYLAMATLGFGTIIYTIALGTEALGSADGINSVPPFTILPGIEVSGAMSSRVSNFYIAWGLVVLSMMALLNLLDSRVGKALRAIHGAEDAAGASGVDTAAYKLRMFVLSAAMASIAGVMLTHYTAGIGPGEAGVMKSVRYVAIVAVGGMASLWGTLVMGTALTFLSLRGYFGTYDDAIFGLVLVVIMLFAPSGLLRLEILDNIKAALGLKGAEERK